MVGSPEGDYIASDLVSAPPRSEVEDSPQHAEEASHVFKVYWSKRHGFQNATMNNRLCPRYRRTTRFCPVTRRAAMWQMIVVGTSMGLLTMRLGECTITTEPSALLAHVRSPGAPARITCGSGPYGSATALKREPRARHAVSREARQLSRA